MKNRVKGILPFIILLFLAVQLNFKAQAQSADLSLGRAARFALFATTGAVSTTGISMIAGDVGANVGAVTGFNASTTSSVYNGSAETAAAATDLLTAYNKINTHGTVMPIPAEVAGLTLTPNTYAIGSAGTLTGTLTLDGGGDNNSVFIIKFGGALSSAAGSSIQLINGALPSNVYIIAEGAISVGANNVLNGEFIAHTGAVTLGAGCTVAGALYSTTGAISIATSTVTNPRTMARVVAPPVPVVSPTVEAAVLGTAANFSIFATTGAVSSTGVSTVPGKVGANVGAITGFTNTSNANDETKKAASDLLAGYTTLNNMTPVGAIPADISGLTLKSGIYAIGSAAGLTGTLTLDGQGNPNALFIIKFGGAFTTAAGSKVVLTNGAQAANVYFIAEGAISVGANNALNGQFIAHTGAITLGAACTLSGELYSTTGAISINTSTVTNVNPTAVASPPAAPTVTVSPVVAPTVLGTAANFSLFATTGAVSSTGVSTVPGKVGANVGAITGFTNTSNANAETATAANDLLTGYNTLNNMTPVGAIPADISGLNLTAGIYSIGSAAGLTGTLTLTGSATDVFIIKFGGAFTTAAGSSIKLVGVNPANVYFIAEGAISVGANNALNGQFIAHTGAITLGAACTLSGELYSTTGAISINTSTVTNVNATAVASPPARLKVAVSPVVTPTVLGSAANFSLFATTGAVSSTGVSTVPGKVGANVGAITGFTNTSNANAETATAANDLLTGYNTLNNMTPVGAIPADISGLTLTPGIYAIGSAAGLTGTLTLDGQGNPNAVFIIKFGGAFTTAAGSSIKLVGVNPANVYFIAEGAISVGANNVLNGQFIAHTGAITLGAACNLSGELYSTTGAISINTSTVTNVNATAVASPPAATPILPSITSTPFGSAAAFALFATTGAVSTTGPSSVTGSVGANVGAITGFSAATPVFNANTITATAATDLLAGYTMLNNIPVTSAAHAAAFGGETLTGGVYAVGSAGSLGGVLTLSGNATDLFIFKFGGALTGAAATSIVLTGGVLASNVYFIAEGAISIGANSNLNGTFVAHTGAVTLGAACTSNGALYSTTGAISINTSTVAVAAVYAPKANMAMSANMRAAGVQIQRSINVFPNPTKGVVKFDMGTSPTENFSLQVFNMGGKMIYSTNHYQPSIDLTNNAVGIYTIRINSNSKITTSKIIIH